MAYNLSAVRSDVKLSMAYPEDHLNPSKGKWAIETHYGRSRSQGPSLLFPGLGRLEELWQEHAPGCDKLHLGAIGHRFPLIANMFQVDGGANSTARQRNKFLKAVLAECRTATPQIGYYSPGAL